MIYIVEIATEMLASLHFIEWILIICVNQQDCFRDLSEQPINLRKSWNETSRDRFITLIIYYFISIWKPPIETFEVIKGTRHDSDCNEPRDHIFLQLQQQRLLQREPQLGAAPLLPRLPLVFLPFQLASPPEPAPISSELLREQFLLQCLVF